MFTNKFPEMSMTKKKCLNASFLLIEFQWALHQFLIEGGELCQVK
jgi:hypothetical protein